MRHKSRSVNGNGNGNARPGPLPLWITLIIFIALIGCSSNLVMAGPGGVEIEGGEWVGQSDDGAFSMQFSIGADGANIFLVNFSVPCGGRSLSVLSSNLIKVPLSNSAFETITKASSDLMPKVKITGRFIDRTHAEGTWESPGLYDSILEIRCPAASGTWSGGPGKNGEGDLRGLWEK